jgi:hypothetical protein
MRRACEAGDGRGTIRHSGGEAPTHALPQDIALADCQLARARDRAAALIAELAEVNARLARSRAALASIEQGRIRASRDAIGLHARSILTLAEAEERQS